MKGGTGHAFDYLDFISGCRRCSLSLLCAPTLPSISHKPLYGPVGVLADHPGIWEEKSTKRLLEALRAVWWHDGRGPDITPHKLQVLSCNITGREQNLPDDPPPRKACRVHLYNQLEDARNQGMEMLLVLQGAYKAILPHAGKRPVSPVNLHKLRCAFVGPLRESLNTKTYRTLAVELAAALTTPASGSRPIPCLYCRTNARTENSYDVGACHRKTCKNNWRLDQRFDLPKIGLAQDPLPGFE